MKYEVLVGSGIRKHSRLFKYFSEWPDQNSFYNGTAKMEIESANFKLDTAGMQVHLKDSVDTQASNKNEESQGKIICMSDNRLPHYRLSNHFMEDHETELWVKDVSVNNTKNKVDTECGMQSKRLKLRQESGHVLITRLVSKFGHSKK